MRQFTRGVSSSDRYTDLVFGFTEKLLADTNCVLEFVDVAGTSKSRLIEARIWVRDMRRDYGAMNNVWNAWSPIFTSSPELHLSLLAIIRVYIIRRCLGQIPSSHA